METDGFYGRYYPVSKNTQSAIIVVTDDAVDGIISKCIVKWVCGLGIDALAVSPEKHEKGYHSYPMEHIEYAVNFLKNKRNEKVGIIGISATGMIALTAASLFKDITLTIALTPSDFIMEGYYQDKKDGARERPGDFESSLTWQGAPLSFLPYAYRHPEYWRKLIEESKRSKNILASREMFDESERRHPVQEEDQIKVENIHGHIYFAAAEDDTMWDACRYIRRMMKRLEEKKGACTFEAHLYEHGTHLIFPESMMKRILPFGVNLILPLIFSDAKSYVKECQAARKDIDRSLIHAINKYL